MASFSLAVYGAPQTSQASFSALQFAKAAYAQGHTLVRVFFYLDGIHNANELVTPPQDEGNLVHQWQRLGQEHSLELVVCIAAALKRGLLDSSEAKRHQKHSSNLADGFIISGLGQLVEAAVISDRLITFGN